MSWLSRTINLTTFSVIFYHTKCEVLNAALLTETVALQMLNVAVGLSFPVISTLQTFYPQVCQSHDKCTLRSDVGGNHIQNCDSPSLEKCPYRPQSRSCRSDRDIPTKRVNLSHVQHLKMCQFLQTFLKNNRTQKHFAFQAPHQHFLDNQCPRPSCVISYCHVVYLIKYT